MDSPQALLEDRTDILGWSGVPEPEVMNEEHKPRVAIVDDDPLIVESFAEQFSDEFQIRTFISPIDALKALPTERVSLVIADLRMPALDGIELLASLKLSVPNVTRVLFTAYADLECLSRAINHAAIFHYIAKDSLGRKGAHSEIANIIVRGIELNQLREERDRLLRRAIEQAEALREENERLKQQRPRLLGAKGFCFSDLIGTSPCLAEVIRRAREAARHAFPVLVYGETGTGKEILSQAIHYEGARKTQRFAALNCSTANKELLISELMGHNKGTFTGASENRIGLLEVVDKGTLFLDEVGEMPLESQAHLLRFLEDGEVRPIGSAVVKHVDVRIIAATHRNLRDEVTAGRFREDLYYRLDRGIELRLPPLRDRMEDLPPLILHLLQRNNNAITQISPEAIEGLMRCEFRGNVRELDGMLQKASVEAIISGENVLLSSHFPAYASSVLAAGGSANSLRTLTDKAQIAVIVHALGQHKTITAAAAHLDLTREGLSRKMKDLGIKKLEGT